MRTPVDLRLLEEAERFRFRFSCESCVHYDAERESCANGYPNVEHRAQALTPGGSLVFCKEFEFSG